MPSCNTYHLTWVSLTSGVGYLFTAAPAKCCHCSLPWRRGISLPPFLTLSLIQFSVDGWGCVPSLLFDLRPNYDGLIQKGCPFHHRGLECKSRKSRDTWSNRQIWPCSTKWSRAKADRVWPRKRTGHRKHPPPTTQENMYGHHQMVSTEIRLIIFFAAKDGEALYSLQKQDWELTVAQIINSYSQNSDLNWRK